MAHAAFDSPLGCAYQRCAGGEIRAEVPDHRCKWGSTAAAQAIFFRYNVSAVANGNRYLISPQAYYYVGPFGLLGEYVQTAQDVKVAAADRVIDGSASLAETGRQVEAAYRALMAVR